MTAPIKALVKAIKIAKITHKETFLTFFKGTFFKDS